MGNVAGKKSGYKKSPSPRIKPKKMKDSKKYLEEKALQLDQELLAAHEYMTQLLEQDDLPSLHTISTDISSLSSLELAIDSGVDINYNIDNGTHDQRSLVLVAERAEMLEENLRQLEARKKELEQNIEKSRIKLKHIDAVAESCRFRQFVLKNPVDVWRVKSSPF